MTMFNIDSPFLLDSICQNYPWGKVGHESLVFQLISSAEGATDSITPYAELWVGAHKKSPSMAHIGAHSIALDELIALDPSALLGAQTAARFERQLPFLFKILSVGKALSIQAHPDRVRAAELHKRAPEHYPDHNHKPEVAIALTTMTLLYGFKEIAQLRAVVSRLPELAELMGKDLQERLREDKVAEDENLFREIYRRIVLSEAADRERLGMRMVERIKERNDNDPLDCMVSELSAVYGAGDIGLFTCYLMNYCVLNPGEGVFVGPNIPHAYLSGDLVECMANSDNVVRAGLTPKFQDVETLIDMLDYRSSAVKIIRPEVANDGVRHYRTPAREFEIAELSGCDRYRIVTGGSVVLVFCLFGVAEFDGHSGTKSLKRGGAMLIPASMRECTIRTSPSSRLFRVAVPS